MLGLGLLQADRGGAVGGRAAEADRARVQEGAVGAVREEFAAADRPRGRGEVADVGGDDRAGRGGPRGVPEGGLLVEAALRGEGVQDRARDVGGEVVLRVAQAEGAGDPLLHEPVDAGAGDLLQRGDEEDVVGVGVAPAGPRLVPEGVLEGVGDELGRGPLAEGVCLQLGEEGRVGDVVVESRGVGGQHPQGDPVRLGQVGQPPLHGVVEVDPALLDELEEGRGDVGEGHGAGPEVHVRLGGDAGHGLAQGVGDDLVSVDGDP